MYKNDIPGEMKVSKSQKKDEAFEALEKIKSTEEKAQKIIQTARDETTAGIIQDAYSEAKRIRENLLNEAREKAEEQKELIIKNAKEEALGIKKETEERIASLYKNIEKKLSDAVEKTADKINKYVKEESK